MRAGWPAGRANAPDGKHHQTPPKRSQQPTHNSEAAHPSLHVPGLLCSATQTVCVRAYARGMYVLAHSWHTPPVPGQGPPALTASGSGCHAAPALAPLPMANMYATCMECVRMADGLDRSRHGAARGGLLQRVAILARALLRVLAGSGGSRRARAVEDVASCNAQHDHDEQLGLRRK